jgi:hypothetical protein
MQKISQLNTLIFILLTSCLYFNSNAAHIVGGEIYYDTVGRDGNGNMIYNVYFELFRECGAAAPFPGNGFNSAPFHFTVFNPNNTVHSTHTLPFNGFSILPLVYDDPCVEPPDNICIESAIYTGQITLPIISGDYMLSYQVGWWSGDYVNFANPATIGMTITSIIPGTAKVGNVPNNSVRFSDYPQIVFCLNQQLSIPSNVLDQDGDSLVFRMCDPLLNNAGLNPDPESPPPYSSIPWEPGFNSDFPFNVSSPTAINPVTGLFTTTPSLIGKFVARICVEEWRNGQLINVHSRTFGYNIVVCESEPAFEIFVLGGGNIIEGCGGITFVIERNDTDGVLPLIIQTSGDAQMGTNYTNLPDTVFIQNGVANDTITVNTIFQPGIDGGLEGTVMILYLNPCTGDLDTASTTFTILDYFPMEVSVVDSINVCSDFGETFLLFPETFTGGVPPYYFNWNNLIQNFPNTDTILVNATILGG